VPDMFRRIAAGLTNKGSKAQGFPQGVMLYGGFGAALLFPTSGFHIHECHRLRVVLEPGGLLSQSMAR
jgi:hypothetical protein